MHTFNKSQTPLIAKVFFLFKSMSLLHAVFPTTILVEDWRMNPPRLLLSPLILFSGQGLLRRGGPPIILLTHFPCDPPWLIQEISLVGTWGQSWGLPCLATGFYRTQPCFKDNLVKSVRLSLIDWRSESLFHAKKKKKKEHEILQGPHRPGPG